MICPNCSTELSKSDIMCSNCGEIFEDNVEIDFDEDAKFIETVNEDELVDIAMGFEDEDFEKYDSSNNANYEVEELFKKNTVDENNFEEDSQEEVEDESEENYSVDEFLENEEVEETEETEDISDEGDNQLNKYVSKEDSDRVYLKQNFHSLEKVVKLVSEDVIEEQEKSITYDEDGQIIEELEEFEDSSDNIEVEVEVSNKELIERIGESAETHQAHIEKEEREKAEEVERYYKEYRFTLLVTLKRIIIFFAVVASGIMIYDLVTNNFKRLSSQIYTNIMIENYDQVTWENIEYIIELDKVLVEGVRDYTNNEISSSELEKIAYNHIKDIDGRNEMFFRSVYSEAEQYIFVASKLAFASQYICENILDYFETGDMIYYNNYIKSTEKLAEFFAEVKYERIEFLRKIGFSEEDINTIINQ